MYESYTTRSVNRDYFLKRIEKSDHIFMKSYTGKFCKILSMRSSFDSRLKTETVCLRSVDICLTSPYDVTTHLTNLDMFITCLKLVILHCDYEFPLLCVGGGGR
jgi:hypothetical protein